MRLMEVVCSFDMGGSEKLAAALAERLRNRGFDTAVCATSGGRGPISDALESKGIPWFAPAAEATNPLSRRLLLARLFRRERVQVLHLHHVSNLALCYWPARLAGVRRLVVTEHTDYELRHTPRVWRRATQFGPKAEAVTVIHRGLEESFAQAGVPAGRLHRIENGVDTSMFAPGRRSPRRSKRPLVIGWVGRMHPDKDLRTWLRSAARVAARATRPVRFSLVGDGPQAAEMRRLADELGLAKILDFQGPQQNIADHLREMDVFVLSSCTEGVPMVLLEAMACGLPCVATSVGGIPEVIEPAWGTLVPARDPDALSDAVLRLMESDDTRRTLGKAARSAAIARFNLERMLDRYAEVLAPQG